MEQEILDVISTNFGSNWVDLQEAVSVLIKAGFSRDDLQDVFEMLHNDNFFGKRIVKRGVSDIIQIRASSA